MKSQLETLHKRVAGIDVHRMKHVVTVLTENEDGTLTRHTREFGGFKRDLKTLAAWLVEMRVERVILESTGIYWKCVHARLEEAGLSIWVVNAHHVKHVPGRKTDVADSEWLAQLGRYGLVRPSFIPPRDLRELRLISRYRQKLVATQAAQTNRLHKLLDDAGIKLSGRLKASREDLLASLEGDLSARHRWVLQEIRDHLNELVAHVAKVDAYLRDAMVPYREAWTRLQTLPGIVAIAHKMIRTIWFMFIRREPYHDTGFDYAAANVKKNAPRWIGALKMHGFVVKLASAN